MTPFLILSSLEIREKAKQWIDAAKENTKVEFKEAKRTNQQNALMWSVLDDISLQVNINGKSYSKDQWKAIFMHELGHQAIFLPNLHGTSFIPYKQSSRELTTKEMSDLMELMFAYAAEKGVVLLSRGFN